jgi:DNA-binding MarR family transcriptional regulator
MSKKKLSEIIGEIERIVPLAFKHFHTSCVSGLVKTEITFQQFLVLQHLFQNDNCRMSDLKDAFGVTLGNMTTMVDRLVREALVARFEDSSDRRLVRVRLTKKGARIIKVINRQKRKKISEIFSRVSLKKLENLLEIMKKVENLIEEEKRGSGQNGQKGS